MALTHSDLNVASFLYKITFLLMYAEMFCREVIILYSTKLSREKTFHS